jgi:hypothetical protein
MNVLINGTSISRGEKSRPYYLKNCVKHKFDMINLAQAGAGNTYIHESIVEEIAQRSYDLVLIQWTYVDRLDIRVKDIGKFSDSEYTTQYQSAQNDWPHKVIYPVNDQDYVQKDWVFGCGYINQRRNDSVGRVFKEYYAVTGFNEHMAASLIKIISLQNTLKTLGIPYLFLEYRPMARFDRFKKLYDLIDWSQFYNGQDLYTIASQRNALDDTLHPSTECHEIYASNLYQDLVNRTYLHDR